MTRSLVVDVWSVHVLLIVVEGRKEDVKVKGRAGQYLERQERCRGSDLRDLCFQNDLHWVSTRVELMKEGIFDRGWNVRDD